MNYICEFCDQEFKNADIAKKHVSNEHSDWLRFIYKTFNVVPNKTVKQAVRRDHD